MRSKRTPHEQFEFVVPARRDFHALDVCEQDLPERPLEHFADPVKLLVGNLPDERREVPEI
jgi:hypothetical protein